MNTPEPINPCTNDQLIAMLVDMDDEVPRAVIDECANRGEPMAQALVTLINNEYGVHDEDLYVSRWPRLHIVMILGLLTSDFAGRALVSALKTAAVEQDEFLMGWLAGYWPALFRNKSASCIADLPKLVDNAKTDLYLRIAGAEVLLSFAHRQDANALDNCLHWIAALAASENECVEFRLFVAALLLNFPRQEHRALVEQLAGKQCIVGPMYSAEDVRSAYDEMRDAPVWDRLGDPWEFYSPEAIAARLQRWTEAMPDESSVDDDNLADDCLEPPATYVRPEPKIGRNEPCSCGSGKKSKKCCST